MTTLCIVSRLSLHSVSYKRILCGNGAAAADPLHDGILQQEQADVAAEAPERHDDRPGCGVEGERQAMLSAAVKNISPAQTKPKCVATSPTRLALAGEM